jgi:energy-coupling factor transport system substrate-specific component
VLLVLYPRIKKWDLLWTDIMDEEDIPVAGGMSRIGGFFMTVSILGGMIGGLMAAFGAGQAFLYKGFGAGGDVGSLGVLLVAGIGSVGLVLSSFIQSMPKKK